MRQVFEQEFRSERAAGFPLLNRVPDTYVRGAMHAFRTLNQTEADRITNILCDFAVYAYGCFSTFGQANPAKPLRDPDPSDDTWAKFQELSTPVFGLKLLKNAIGWQQSEHEHIRKQVLFPLPDDLVAEVNSITTAKAPLLRRIIKAKFAERFDLKPVSMGGGDWEYVSAGGSALSAVEIDFGGSWGQQLRYTLTLSIGDRKMQRINYERLFRVGLGDWDYITEDSAEEAIDTLCDLITRCTDLCTAASNATTSTNALEP